MLVCTLFDANRTRDRGCSAHPVFPAPSVSRARFSCKTPGASRRENAKLYLAVIASEAKQSISPRKEGMDRFAGARNDVDIAGASLATTRPTSKGRISAIDHESISRMIRRCLAHDVDRDAAEIRGLAEAAHRNARHHVGDELVIGHDGGGHIAL